MNTSNNTEQNKRCEWVEDAYGRYHWVDYESLEQYALEDGIETPVEEWDDDTFYKYFEYAIAE